MAIDTANGIDAARENARLKSAARRAADPEKYRAYQKAWWAAASPEQMDEYKRRRAVWHAANRGKIRARRRIVDGLPEPTRPEPLACECCGKTELSKALCLDHCHETGKFRGWLCTECNSAIGKLGDNAGNVMRAVEYLRRAEL